MFCVVDGACENGRVRKAVKRLYKKCVEWMNWKQDPNDFQCFNHSAIPWCLYYCVWTQCALKSYELYTSGTVPDISICIWQRLCPQITHDTVTKKVRVAASFLRTLLKWRQSTLQFCKKVLNFARNSYCLLSFQKVIWSAQKLHEFLEYLWYIWVCVTCVDCVTGIFPSTLSHPLWYI